jgi:hypothetical protein
MRLLEIILQKVKLIHFSRLCFLNESSFIFYPTNLSIGGKGLNSTKNDKTLP